MQNTYQVMFAYIFGSASTIIDQQKIKNLKSSSERRKGTFEYNISTLRKMHVRSQASKNRKIHNKFPVMININNIKSASTIQLVLPAQRVYEVEYCAMEQDLPYTERRLSRTHLQPSEKASEGNHPQSNSGQLKDGWLEPS